jgi:hypothetical protein
VRLQPAIQLEGEPQRPPQAKHWISLTTPQKALAVTLLLGLIWVRSLRRRKKVERICSVCNTKNARHLTNCTKCGAPLFVS